MSLRGQARYPFRPTAEIRRDQSRRVQRMVAYACRYVPYYRETLRRLDLTPADFECVDDLAKLPVIEREQLQRDPEAFLSTAAVPDRSVSLRTSGRSGAPIQVWYDIPGLLLALIHSERLRSIIARCIGQRRGYRETTVFSPGDTTTAVRKCWRRHVLAPPFLSTRRQTLSLHDPVEALADAIENFRPDVLSAYGSLLGMLFPHAAATGCLSHAPKAVVYGADVLEDSVRHLMSDRFGIEVFSSYQSVEAGSIAFECEQHTGLHQNADIHPVRIADEEGRTLPPGDVGDVIVSNLVNRATVLLNYRLGDLATLHPEPCPCGRTLPLMSYPQGRRDDVLVLPSGRRSHPMDVLGLFRSESQIWRYQVVQEKPDGVAVRIVAADACDRDALTTRLLGRFRETFGPGLQARVEFVQHIDRTSAGKHKAVVSHVASHSSRP
jgi:phenylacetate-CoA ligase